MNKQAAYLSNTVIVCLAASLGVATEFTDAIASKPYPGPVFGSAVTGILFLAALLWGAVGAVATDYPKTYSLVGAVAVIIVGHLGMYAESWMTSASWVGLCCGVAVTVYVVSSLRSDSE